MRIVFMGTPDFAVGTLEAIIQSKHEVAAVVTQPDKPKGRSKTPTAPPVKEAALSHGIPVLQPIRVRERESLEEIQSFGPDIIVVAAFGQILPRELLDMPKFGCINVHASLLPKYRGAAPIQRAIMDGESRTGVTIMKMEEGLDTGDMILKRALAIEPKETGGSLFDRLSAVGAKLCVEALSLIEEGKAVYEKQDDSQSTYAKMLKKETGKIDWNQDARSIERLIRALNPWPSAYTYLNGAVMKIWEADVLEADGRGTPGEIIESGKSGLLVQTGAGVLALREVQLAGKKRMSVGDFLRGNHVETGILFES